MGERKRVNNDDQNKKGGNHCLCFRTRVNGQDGKGRVKGKEEKRGADNVERGRGEKKFIGEIR